MAAVVFRATALWLTLSLAITFPCIAEPVLSSSSPEVREGYFVLSWSDPQAASQQYLLQVSSNQDFTAPIQYEVVPQGDITLSGYASGEYFFRVGQVGNWSETVKLTVDHYPLSQALSFLVLGLILFLILCFTIFRGPGSLDRQAVMATNQTGGGQ